jgi:hypothetical protein
MLLVHGLFCKLADTSSPHCMYTCSHPDACRPPVIAAATDSLASLQLQLQRQLQLQGSTAAHQQWELANGNSAAGATGSPDTLTTPPPQLQHQHQQQQQQEEDGSWQQKWGVAREPLIKGALSAPVIAGIVAIMIGSCPPLQVGGH